MSDKNITLYYADWCGHCTTFKPTWEKIKSQLDDNGIAHNEYEHGKDKAKVEEANIEGFPTIKITLNGKTTDYNGPRTSKDILKHFGVQSGGGSYKGQPINYHHKYMKYKKKYQALKEKQY